MLGSSQIARAWRRRIASGCGFALCLSLAEVARTNSDAPALVRALGELPGAPLPESLLLPDGQRMLVIGRFAAGTQGRALGFVPVGSGFGVRAVTPAELLTLDNLPGTKVSWSPPRHLLLDQATRWTRAQEYRVRTAETGAGVVIGIVDSGIDASHPDFSDAAGRTRVLWWLDFSRSPAGLHPELEAEYGCGDLGCAIYQGEDLDAGVPPEPRDPLGHGTHVASLAAGNGRSDSPPRLVGVAPEATLIGVRVTRQNGATVADADLLLGVRFVFERAAEAGMPAVVNLSLGSDFGAHDGSSLLEQALASLVGPEYPGRAVVLAAGNSGTLHTETGSGYPEPLGVHSEVHVPRDSSVRVPILSPPMDASDTYGSVYVWIRTRSEDELAIGFERDGASLPLVRPGGARSMSDGQLVVTVLNRVGEYAGMPLGERGAVVVIDGSWRTGSVFALRLEGHGTANLWLQSEGQLAPEWGTIGAVFPRASAQSTINVPATHPALIAVGATLDRTAWTDRTGQAIELSNSPWYGNASADSIAYFSAAGPTAAGLIKPDLVAPGAFVMGAMSGTADPAENGGQGIFAYADVCPDADRCLVVDDRHAVLTGTSMAAPLVSGAVALLFEHQPGLTQDRVRTLLQAGARRLGASASVEQRVGPGALDLMGTLDVMEREHGSAETLPSATESWLTLSDVYAHPDPGWPVEAMLSLRSATGEVADGFSAERLAVSLSIGTLEAPLRREAPGFWRFSFACPSGTGGRSLELRVAFDGLPLIERWLPIAVDRSVATAGWMAQGGSCRTAGTAPDGRTVESLIGGALAVLLVRRRRRFARERGTDNHALPGARRLLSRGSSAYRRSISARSA